MDTGDTDVALMVVRYPVFDGVDCDIHCNGAYANSKNGHARGWRSFQAIRHHGS
jgi:hypothetical protein